MILDTVQMITIEHDEDGQRLDRWFKRRFPMVGFGSLQKAVRKGQVRVDGKKVKTGDVLTEGAVVRVPPFADEQQHNVRVPKKITLTKRERAEIKSIILYEDDAMLILNKPWGLAVQGGTGQIRSLDEDLNAYYSEEKVTPKLIHRLDRDTSGVIVVAKTLKASQALAASLKAGKFDKEYWAMVVGEPLEREGFIYQSIAKVQSGKAEKMQVVEEGGKEAITEYEQLAKDTNVGIAWLRLVPKTGRTHQLRVHCSWMGCPVLGDGKYRIGKQRFEDLSGRMHLHARRLRFPHPFTGKPFEIFAPASEHMQATCAILGFDLPRTPDTMKA